MVAIIAGTGLGLERSSAWVLGARGQLGVATQGRGADNVYVNAATGNLVIRNTDEMLMGIGLNNGISRTHNSLGATDGDNNDGWRESLMRTVAGLTGTVNQTNSTITRTDWDGSQVVYKWNGSNAYVTTDGQGAYDTLAYNTSTQVWTWTDGDTRVTETYDGANGGRITGQTDLDLNKITYTYTSGKLTRVATQAASGGTAEFTDIIWGTGGAANNILQIETSKHTSSATDTLTKLTRVRYGYDTSNRLQTVTVDLSPNDNAVTDGKTYVTTYGYDGTSKRVSSITQSDGSKLEIAYTTVGSDMRVSKLTQYVVGTTGKRETNFAYDTTNRTTTITDPLSQATTLAYDAAGQLTRITSPSVAGGAALVTQFEYNATTGDVTKIIAPTGSTVVYTYDANGNRISETDSLNNKIERVYDTATNTLRTETRYLDGGTSTPVTTRYAYDSKNHLRYVVSAEGYVTQYVYNSLGQQTSVIEYAGTVYNVASLTPTTQIATATLDTWATSTADKVNAKRTDTTYNFRGQVATVTSFSKLLSTGLGDTGAERSITNYTYDQAGRLLNRQIATSTTSSVIYATESFVYDGLGRVTASTDFASNSVSTVYNDASGSTVVTNNATGLIRTSTYNLAGELVSYGESGGSGSTSYAYDADGRLRSVTDPLGRVTYTLYDEAGRKTFDIGPDGAITEYAYTPNSLIARTIRYATKLTATQIANLPAGSPTATQLTALRPTAQASDRWEWRVYDDAQRLVETIDSTGAATVYQYDGAGRQTAAIAYATRFTATAIAGFKSTAPTTLQTPTTSSSNGGPTIVTDTPYATAAGAAIEFQPAANDTDPDGDPLTLTRTEAPANGSLSRIGNVLTYQPNPGFTGSETIVYYVTDGKGHEQQGSVTIVVGAVANQAPLPQNDTDVATVGTEKRISVLLNDEDPDHDVLNVITFTQGAFGTVTRDGNVLIYKGTQVGEDHFDYWVNDGRGGPDVKATVTIRVDAAPTNNLPVARGEEVNVNPGEAKTILVLQNDTDLDTADVLSIKRFDATSAKGTITQVGNTLVYTPNSGASGDDEFYYTITDGKAESTAKVVVHINAAANTAPTAGADAINATVGQSVTFNPLTNDDDVDHDPLTIVGVTQGGKGAVSFTGGLLTYNPSGATGTDTFTYTISDGRGGTKTATVTVTIAAAPQAAANQWTALAPGGVETWYQASSGDFAATSQANYLGQGYAALLIQKSTSAPEFDGTVSDAGIFALWGGGSGPDIWSVSPGQRLGIAFEARGLGVADQIQMSVRYWDANWNELPDVAWETTATPAGGWTQVQTILTAPSGAAHAALMVDVNAVGNKSGTNSTYGLAIRKPQFSVLAAGQGLPGYNAAPVTANDTLTTSVGVAASVQPLLNDSDPDGDALTITAVGTPAHGTVSLVGGTITYTPTAGYVGADSFTYTVSDGKGGTKTGTVNVTVQGANQAPVAVNDSATTSAGQAVTFNPLSNDSDPDGDTLVISSVGAAANGIVTKTNNAITYTPANGFTGVDSFTYTISDGRGGTKTATVTVTVTAASTNVRNEFVFPTVGATDVWDTDAGKPYTGSVQSNYLGQGYAALLMQKTLPANAASYDGAYTYPGAFSIMGDEGPSDWALAGGDRLGLALDLRAFGVVDKVKVQVFYWDANWNDAGAPAEQIVNVTTSGWASLSTILTAPASARFARVVIQPMATGDKRAANTNFGVAIRKPQLYRLAAGQAMPTWNLPPTAANDTVSTTTGAALTFNPLTNDSDVDGDTLTISAVGTAAHGTVTKTNTSITYTPAAGYVGADSFTYTVSDGKGGLTTATVNVTVGAASAPTNQWVTLTPAAVNGWYDGGTNAAYTPTSQSNYLGQGFSALLVQKNFSTGDYDGVSTDIGQFEILGAAGPDHWAVQPGKKLGIGFEARALGVADRVGFYVHFWDANFNDLTDIEITPQMISSGGWTAVQGTATVPANAAYAAVVLDVRAGGDRNGTSNTGGVAIRRPQFSVLAAGQSLPSWNIAPNAANDTLVTTVGVAATVLPLNNDSDPDGDALTISAVGAPSHGAVVFTGTSITYSPTAGYTGTDSFTYTVSDGKGGFKTATVNVTVGGGVNRAPVAVNDTLSAVSGAEKTFNPLANDSDPDGDALTISAIGTAAHGTVTISNGQLVYKSAAGYTGSDSFTYTVSDGRGLTTTATVNVTVTAAPTQTNEFVSLTTSAVIPYSNKGTTVDYSTSLQSNYLGGGFNALVLQKTLANASAEYDGSFTYSGSVGLAGASGASDWVVTGGERLGISFELRALGLTTRATVRVQYWDANWNDAGLSDPTTVTINTSGWTQAQATVNAPAGARYARVIIDPAAAGDKRAAGNSFGIAIRKPQFYHLTTGQSIPAYSGQSAPVQSMAFQGGEPQAQSSQSQSVQAAPQGVGSVQALVAVPTVGAEDRVTRTFYDNDGRVIGVLDPEGYLTQTKYDAAGQKVRTVRYATAANGVDAAATATLRGNGTFSQLLTAVGTTTTDISNWYFYDGRGSLTATIDGEGDVTRYGYNAMGDVNKKTTGLKVDPTNWNTTPPTFSGLPTTPPSGQVLDVVDYVYDAFGKLTKETKTLTGGGTEVTDYAYNADHLLTTRTAASNIPSIARTERQFYDARGRLTGVLSGEGVAKLPASPTQTDIDNALATHGVRYVYDNGDRLIAKIEGNGANTTGQKTLYYYDANDRLTYEVNALGEVTQYGYDVFGGRNEVTQYYTRIATGTLAGLTGGAVTTTLTNAIATHALDAKTSVTYDERGQVKTSTKWLDASTSATSNFTYNAFGELVTQVDPLSAGKNTTTALTYDRRGLLATTTIDASVLGLTTRQTYDAFGRLLQTRDASGRTTGATYDRTGRTVTTIDGKNATRSFTYDARGSVLTSTDATGAKTTFVYSAFNRSVTSTIQVTPTETVTTVTTTNAHGEKIAFTDGAGRTTTWSYDKNGQLAKVIDNAGKTIESNASDALGRLVSSINALGARTEFTYDAANRMATRTVDPTGLNLRTTYQYDGQGYQTTVVEGAGTGAAVTTTYLHDRAGRRTSVTVGGLSTTTYEYDLADRTTTVTAGVGADQQVTVYVYDGADRLTQTRLDPTGQNILTDYIYDEAGNAVAKTGPYRSGQTGEKTRFVYDANNRPVYVIDPAGDVTFTRYDNEGRVVETTTYAARISAADLAGLSSSLSVNDMASRAASLASAADETTRYVYDGAGRLRFTIDATSQPIEYVYDGAGNVIHVTRYGGAIAPSSSPDIAFVQNQISTKGLAGLVNTQTTRSVYDAAGRLAFSINALGEVTAFDHDPAGNVTYTIRYVTKLGAGTTPPLGSDPTWAQMDGWRFAPTGTPNVYASNPYSYTKTIYDGVGHPRFSFDAEGYVAERQYDALGHVTAELRYREKFGATGETSLAFMSDWASTRQAQATKTSYQYDTAGRLTDTIRKIDMAGATTQTHFELNALGMVIRETAAYGTAEASVILNDYDGAGHLISRTLAPGKAEETATSYEYDGAGNVTKITDGDGFVTVQTWKAGRLATVTTAFGSPIAATTSYGYDAFGNRVTVTDPRNNIGYFYFDKLNRVSLQVDPEGYATETTYVFGDQPATVTRLGRKPENVGSATVFPTIKRDDPSKPLDPKLDAVTTFKRDKLGRVTDITDAMGFTETYRYDFAGRVDQIINRLRGTTVREYDLLDRVTSETVLIEDTRINPTTQYQYLDGLNWDGLSRKVVLEGVGAGDDGTPLRTTTYVYDLLGREIQKVGDEVPVTRVTLPNGPDADGDNLLASVEVDPVTPISYTKYDKRGNVIETIDPSGAHTYTYYDALNRKVSQVTPAGTISAPKGALTTWTYDDNGNVTATRTYATFVTVPPASPPSAPTTQYDRETTYEYDQANRLKASKITNVRVGSYSGTSYTSSITTLVTLNGYDAAGNLTSQTDPNGNVTYNYYDKLGRKVGQVDALGYLTLYQLDGEGNVTREQRFANALTANSYSATTNIAALAAAVTTSGDNDRVTEFLYDLNGRRTRETRLSVQAVTISSTGVVSGPTSVSSVIRYTYNGLGQVLSKVEATGEEFTYRYDTSGRQTWSIGPNDNEQGGIQAHTRYAYNALGDVETIYAGGTNLGDRITQYVYGVGGRLVSMTDANDFTRHYEYDASGRLVKESYRREQTSGGSESDAILYAYDQAGRLIQQTTAYEELEGSWTASDVSALRYDAFGQVTGKGINVVGNAFQETFDYDLAGRVWRTNAGDGVYRVYLYDGAGNKTFSVMSNGTYDLGVGELEIILAARGGVAGLTAPSTQFTTTAYSYNKRNEAERTIEFHRQIFDGSVGSETKIKIETLYSSKTYNAFGEVTSTTDQNNAVTSYQYNTLGKIIRKINPAVKADNDRSYVVDANGRPLDTGVGGFYIIEAYRYDASGRLIQSYDGHGVETRRLLKAGTGYGGQDALTLREFHSDGGVIRYTINAFNDVTTVQNELGFKEERGYDGVGRLISLARPGTDKIEVETYRYDGLGQQIARTSSTLLARDLSKGTQNTRYDAQGRVVATTSFEGLTTYYDYKWGATGTTGLGNYGSWTKQTYLPYGFNSGSETQIKAGTRTDYFGRQIAQSDNNPGGGEPIYIESSFDKAGRLVTRVANYANGYPQGSNFTYTYFNTGQVATIVDTSLKDVSDTDFHPVDATGTSRYYYDAVGHRVYETYDILKEGLSKRIQETAGYYDAAGRLTAVLQGISVDPALRFLTQYYYTANGDIRRIVTTHSQVPTPDPATPPNPNGVDPGPVSEDFWYDYDSMGRMTLSQGQKDINNNLVRGNTGTSIEYDAAGQRTSVIISRADANNANLVRDHKENYAYYPNGYLLSTSAADSAAGYVLGTTPPGLTDPEFHTMSSFVRDAMGRVKSNTEYNSAGLVVFAHDYEYNADSQVTSDIGFTRQNGGAAVSNTTVYTYDGGLLRATRTTGAGQATIDTNYNYVFRDRALQSSIVTTTSGGQSRSDFDYDANGNIRSVTINDGRFRVINYTTDVNGRVLKRAENGGAPNNPVEYYFYFDGMRIGEIGNNGSNQLSYAETINARTAAVQSGAFRSGSPAQYANFDQNYTPINSQSAQVAGSGSTYTVRQGDSLQSIAKAIWGDESLWYILADANGLSAAASLPPGMALTIPSKVTNVRNTSETFKVYDPNEALGDVQPTPRPGQLAQASPKKGACGGVGSIIVAVVAIAVAFYVGPQAIAAVASALGNTGMAAATIAATANVVGTGIAAAIGSAVSQGVGVATGLQDKFSWNAVALAAVSAGVAKGVSLNPALAKVGNGSAFVNGAVRQGLTNVVSQGIGLATGLQSKFDWGGVAVASVIGGVSNSVEQLSPFKGTETYQPNAFVRTIPGAAGGIAGAAARSLVTGTDFGDNLRAALPDVIGATVGNTIVNYMQDQVISKAIAVANAAADPSNPRFAGKTIQEITDLRVGDAARASGDQRFFLDQAGEGSALRKVFGREAELIVAARDAGLSIDDPLSLIGRSLSGDEPAAAAASGSGDEVVVTGRKVTFGDVAARTLVQAQETLDTYTAGTREVIRYGLAVLKGGPVGALGTYALDQGIGIALRASGADKAIHEVVTATGAAGLSVLSRSDYENALSSARTDNGREAGLLVEAGSTILGITSLGKLLSTARTEGLGNVARRFIADESGSGPSLIGGKGARAAEGAGNSLPVAFDGEFATQQLLGTTATPGGRQIMFHAADRMVNPPAGRVAMSPAEIDQVLDGATSVDKWSYHPQGDTLTIRNANMPGSPRVIVDAATGQRVITVINPRIK